MLSGHVFLLLASWITVAGATKPLKCFADTCQSTSLDHPCYENWNAENTTSCSMGSVCKTELKRYPTGNVEYQATCDMICSLTRCRLDLPTFNCVVTCCRTDYCNRMTNGSASLSRPWSGLLALSQEATVLLLAGIGIVHWATNRADISR